MEPIGSSPTAHTLSRRLPRWLRRTIRSPLAACQVCLLFLTNYRRLFAEALAGSWPYRLHPWAYYSLCIGLLISVRSFDVRPLGWYEVMRQLPQNQLIFAEVFSFDVFSEETRDSETLLPGSSKASAEMRNQVGSDSAEAVGAYLRNKDPQLAATWDKQLAVMSTYERARRWFEGSIWAVTFFSLVVIAVPTHFVLRTPGRTIKDTVYVVLYLLGFLWIVEALLHLILNRMASPRFSSNPWFSLPAAFICLALCLSIPVTWWRTLRFTNKASHTRIFVCLLAVGSVYATVVLGVLLVLDKAGIPMPQSNGIQSF
jgi:hypothetical protein